MPPADPDGTAREAAAPVPMVQRPPQRLGNRSRPGSDLHDLPPRVVPRHHPARVARQPLRRSRGNVAPLFQHGLAGLRRIRQDRGVHVAHHLIPLPRRPGTSRLVHEEKGEIVDYFTAGELREMFAEWRVLRNGERVISCAQDGSVHGHSVEELAAARPVGPAPWPSET